MNMMKGSYFKIVHNDNIDPDVDSYTMHAITLV